MSIPTDEQSKPILNLTMPDELLKAAGMNEKEREAFNIAINLPMFQRSIGGFGMKMVKQGFRHGFIVGVLLTGAVALLATMM